MGRRMLSLLTVIILLCILLYSLVIQFDSSYRPSHFGISLLSLLTSIFIVLYIHVSKRLPILGHTVTLLLYTIFTQFGAGIAVHVFPKITDVSQFGIHARWLTSVNYVKAMALGLSSVIVYALVAVLISKNRYRKLKPNSSSPQTIDNSNGATILGFALVYIVFCYLTFSILTGQFSINSSYSDFRLWTQDASFYGFSLVMLATGFVFVIACGTKKQIKHMLWLYGIISMIMLLTGNKGEVYYAALAAIGVYVYRFRRIDPKIILFGLLSIFIIIPSVTTLRSSGVLSSINQIGLNLTAPFVEMGFQLRLSVFILDDFDAGRNYLMGFSYYNPIVNIANKVLPLLPRLTPPVDFNFAEQFRTMGFSQVAESYANFGVLGCLLFYSVLAVVVTQFDDRGHLPLKRALHGGWLVVFINMTRNKFAFVPGQLLVILGFYFISRVLDRLSDKGTSKRRVYRARD